MKDKLSTVAIRVGVHAQPFPAIASVYDDKTELGNMRRHIYQSDTYSNEHIWLN